MGDKMEGIKKVGNKNFESLEDFLDEVMHELEKYLEWLDDNSLTYKDSKQEIVTQKVYDMLNSINCDSIYKDFKLNQ
jgi:hypothetical protein